MADDDGLGAIPDKPPDAPVNQLGYPHFYSPNSGWFYGPYPTDPQSTDMRQDPATPAAPERAQVFQSWDDFPLVDFTEVSSSEKRHYQAFLNPDTQQFWLDTFTKQPMELDPSAYRKGPAGKPPELVPGTQDVMPGEKRPRTNIDPTLDFLTDPQTLET